MTSSPLQVERSEAENRRREATLGEPKTFFVEVIYRFGRGASAEDPVIYHRKAISRSLAGVVRIGMSHRRHTPTLSDLFATLLLL